MALRRVFVGACCRTTPNRTPAEGPQLYSTVGPDAWGVYWCMCVARYAVRVCSLSVRSFLIGKSGHFGREPLGFDDRVTVRGSAR